MNKDILVTFIVNDSTLTVENPTKEFIAELKQQYPDVIIIEEEKKQPERNVVVYFSNGFYLELKNPTDELVADACKNDSNAIVCESNEEIGPDISPQNNITIQVSQREPKTVVMNPMGSTHLFSLFSLSE
jgi:hypothetical protein